MQVPEDGAVLGLDLGGVVFYPLGGQVPGALEHIQRIASAGRFRSIYIVSRANGPNRLYFLLRLSLMRFWRRTGIMRTRLYFCSRNSGKAAICERFGITHFVDDRPDVLRRLGTVPRLFAFRPDGKELRKFPELRDRVVIVEGWGELARLLAEE